MDKLLSQFESQYEEFKKKPNLLKQHTGKEFYQLGVYLYNNAGGIELKNYILEKIIHLFPNEPEIHFYIGFTNKYTDRNRALIHYKKSYELNPNNLENMIDLCNMLYENDDAKTVLDMDKNNFFNQFLHDDRFITLYVQCKIKEGSYENCLKYYLYLIDKFSKKKEGEMTEKEKEMNHSYFMNTAHIYSNEGDFKNCIKYAQKSIELSKRYKLDTDTKVSTYSNFLCYYDYEYPDSDEYYQHAIGVNDYFLDNEPYHFSFSNRKKNGKIRVGYVSADFTFHAVSNFMLPILKNCNRDKFEIYLYSNLNEKTHCPLYLKLGFKMAHIRDVSALDVAKMIYNDEIDILIDLGGHTAKNRLDVFTYKPAPIQVTYVGYPNTTGLKTIQYRITDPIADCIDTTQKYSEELVRLPKCFLIFESIIQTKPVELRKTSNKIVFGSLNKETKNTKYTLKAWKTILNECPNSILLIKIDSTDNADERLKHYMDKLGVPKNRLLIMNKKDDNGYVKMYSMVDIVLDTFPYSGTTTTCNSLYNSIPVVTLYNKNYHSHNVSTSLLINSGLPELVTYSVEEYIQLAKKIANDNDLLDEYKKTIHSKFVELMNPVEFTKDYEDALGKMYDKYYTDESESENKNTNENNENKNTNTNTNENTNENKNETITFSDDKITIQEKIPVQPEKIPAPKERPHFKVNDFQPEEKLTLYISHDHGFFSCCSGKLYFITCYFNDAKKLPDEVDSSKQFTWYKNTERDITYDYFEHYNNVNEKIIYNNDVKYEDTYQYINYKLLNYKEILPFIKKYFSPSRQILNIVKSIEEKYKIQSYDNICVLFYRGNDKATETELCSYKLVLKKANEVLSKNPNIKFLIQSDETEFITLMRKTFPTNSFYFKDEIRSINRQCSTVDILLKDKNYEFSKYYLAITIIMSKCKYVVCGSSGNCSIWIAFYRGNANNMYQFLKGEFV